MNTNAPFVTTVTPPHSHNIQMNTHIPSDPLTTPLNYQKKGPHLHTIQCFYIHVEAASNNYLNDSHTVFPNRIFDTILKTYHP